MTKHIHLDTVGGIAGNMFAGALLDCLPVTLQDIQEQIESAGFGDLVKLDASPEDDGVLTGTLFSVELKAPPSDLHEHRHYADIRQSLENSSMADDVKGHALGIFRCLAEAEAAVHGKTVEQVAFHEVGAWDSIADIIAAACLISYIDADSWSVSSLPTGNGQVKTAHGMLPLPAPATTELLKGFRFHNDGLEGERVTPTGAAILHYLAPGRSNSVPMDLKASGIGFGNHRFTGLSNVLRVMVFSDNTEDRPWREERILELAFEVDDQQPEDLALALNAIRQHEGVLDLCSYPVQGKKNRLASSVRILLEPEAGAEVVAQCFNETNTLGIRQEMISRNVLRRMEVSVPLDGREYRAKVVQRPNGELTVKAESDDIREGPSGQAERELLRQEIETLALDILLQESGDEA